MQTESPNIEPTETYDIDRAEAHDIELPDRRTARQNQAIVQALEALLNMPGVVLEVLPTILQDAVGIADEGLSDTALRRLVMRVFCVQRFCQLRRSTHTEYLTQRGLVEMVNRAAASIDPSWRCSLRALQSWIAAWNRPGADGRACGWRGLLRPHRTGPRWWAGRSGRRPGRSGRKPSQSPEAVAFFKGLFVDRKCSSLAKCHRLTLAEARRRGWDWPATREATQAWWKRESNTKGERKTCPKPGPSDGRTGFDHAPTGVRSRVDRRSDSGPEPADAVER